MEICRFRFATDSRNFECSWIRAEPHSFLTLPIGISFFTFHHLSYIIDVYRKSRRAQKSPVQFVTYIAMFPQLIAGPISDIMR